MAGEYEVDGLSLTWTLYVVCTNTRPGSGFDSGGVVRPSFNNCTIYNLHVYASKHHCEEYYDNVSDHDKQRQRLRFERAQQRQQQEEEEQNQQQQQQQDGGVDSYVEFSRRQRLSSSNDNAPRRRP